MAKDEIENDLEELVKGVLERDIQLSLQQTGASTLVQKNTSAPHQSSKLKKFSINFYPIFSFIKFGL